MKKILVVVLIIAINLAVTAQVTPAKFGKGITIEGEDFKLKAAFRFQSLYVSEWNIRNDDFKYVEDLQTNFLVRRSRLKFDGWAYSPKLKYKLELGLSNRDLSGGDGPEYSNASRMILDAYLEWNFYKGFSILAGQTKLPGNRERIISSANMQFVDRSRLNSRFTLDRDMGVMLKHKQTIGEQFNIKSVYSLAQGEGRNVTAGNLGGGLSHTLKIEFYPFGDFTSKGDYTGGDLKREQKPKLALAFAYNINENASRERGQGGSFIINETTGEYFGKTLNTFYADLMFKYKGFSLMGEYVYRATADNDPNAYYDSYFFGNGEPSPYPGAGISTVQTIGGTYYTGSAINLQGGYLFESNWEVAGRYTIITPQNLIVGNTENEYGIALSKYVVGHKLKVQTDLGYRQVDNKDDKLFWRVQMDIHF
jgi:phosphate-selective porin OprO/OprP